jgi:hypothetical protein
LAKGQAEGLAEGQARAVVKVLEARGISVSAELRAQILSCGDLRLLERWLGRAVTAASAEAVVTD